MKKVLIIFLSLLAFAGVAYASFTIANNSVRNEIIEEPEIGFNEHQI